MSMTFDQPVNPETRKLIEEHFGKPYAEDGKTFLFNQMETIDQRVMKEIANKAKQPATVELDGKDTIRTMSDGTRYQVTEKGWVKLWT